MDLAGIGSIISGIGGIGSGIAQTILNDKISKQNLQFQKDVFNYQKQLQRELFQREDSAIRRRAQDIAAAGGNPAVAWETGSGAGSGSPVSVTTPQRAPIDMSLINSSLSQVQQGLELFSQNKLRSSQIRNIDAQTSKTNAETSTEFLRQLQVEEQTAKTEEEKDFIRQQRNMLIHDLGLSVEQGLRSFDTKNQLFNTADAVMNSVLPDFKDDNKLLAFASQVGLFLIPGIAGAKITSKVAKSLYNHFRLRGLPKSSKEFIVTYKNAFGKTPTGKQIGEYRKFISNADTFEHWNTQMLRKSYNYLQKSGYKFNNYRR